MSEIITINNQPVTVKTYQGQRVTTFKDIDTVHNRPEGTAKRNFTENKDRLIEGVDYFELTTSQKDEIRTLEIPNRGITILTESGYLMLVKSFTDDLAWTVQRDLVNKYFRVKKEKNDKAKHYVVKYPVGATSLGEVASFWRGEDKVMRDQKSSPHKRAKAFVKLCKQFDIELPEDFVEPEQPTFEQLMITTTTTTTTETQFSVPIKSAG